MMDALGCAFGGHSMPGVPPIVDLTKEWGGRADATIWFDDTKVPVPAAAFVNSVQLHALDFDDYHGPSDAHITAVLVPTVLTMGELQDASGQETLAALVLGAEVIGRLGRAHKARKAHSGFLPTSVIGGFGATAAACRLQGCSVEQTVNALGIWYAHASGNRQALFDRTLTKRIQPGIAARAAVFAACLAQRDFGGPRRIVGGQSASLTRIYGCRPDAEPPSVAEIMREYDTWQIEQLQYKCYACCGYSGKAIAAAIALATENRIEPQDIKEIRVFGDSNDSPFAGVPWEESSHPHVLAQFCLPYAAASAIKNRRYGPDEIAPARIAEDREVDALARRTRLCPWDQWQGPRPKSRFAMQVLLNDGRILETTQNNHRRYRWPKDQDKLVTKFKNNVTFSGQVNERAAEEMVTAIEDLDACKNIRDFIRRYLVN
jgi:2-methylcitrate dehydratase PrpD